MFQKNNSEIDILYNFLNEKQHSGDITKLSIFEDQHKHPLKDLFSRFMVEYTYPALNDLRVTAVGGSFTKSHSLLTALAEAVERLFFLKYAVSTQKVFSFNTFLRKTQKIDYQNSNGFALHNSFIKCLESSLNEMIERHEMLKMWYSTTPPKFEFDFSTLGYINSFHQEIADNHGQLRLFYVSKFKGFHTVLFTLYNNTSNDYLILSSFASDLNIFNAIKRAFLEISRSYLSKPKKNINEVEKSVKSVLDHTLFYQKRENIHYFNFILNQNYKLKQIRTICSITLPTFKFIRILSILVSLKAEVILLPTKEFGLASMCCLKVRSPYLLEIIFGEKHKEGLAPYFSDITGLSINTQQGPHPLA